MFEPTFGSKPGALRRPAAASNPGAAAVVLPFPDTGRMPGFSPPLAELRKAALPSLATGSDPRGWPRLSFRIEPGQLLALRADRGTGAEVLGLIARKTAPAAGVVCLEGRDIWLMSGAEIRERVALVDAAELPDPAASLRQTLARACLPPGCDWGEVSDAGQRAAIAVALERMGLADRAAQPAGSLDAAGRLALLIARALVAGPKVLLIDASSAAPEALAAVEQLAGALPDAGEDEAAPAVILALAGDLPFPAWARDRLDLRDGRF